MDGIFYMIHGDITYVYDPAEHDGVAFEELPDDRVCPRCRTAQGKIQQGVNKNRRTLPAPPSFFGDERNEQITRRRDSRVKG